ncbi:hypothetical protein [Streptomyces sp. URMC 124]|uniref:hypothetical protein n=1 Tax=Streptomyces sp. URMC 124 TaxID=3423405 RepID=UPI003F19A38A
MTERRGEKPQGRRGKAVPRDMQDQQAAPPERGPAGSEASSRPATAKNRENAGNAENAVNAERGRKRTGTGRAGGPGEPQADEPPD